MDTNNDRLTRARRIMVAALASAAIAVPAFAQHFSADVVHTGDREGPPGKIYVSDGKVRMEGMRGPAGAVIADEQAGTTYVLIPQQKAYVDLKSTAMFTQVFIPVDPNNPCPQWQKMANAARQNGPTWTCSRVGGDTINGRRTVKYKATSSDGKTYFGWLDTGLRFLVKSEDAAGNGMELRNIKEGAQPASLFEPPSDYQKYDNMQQMMMQMMQQRMQGGMPQR